MILAQVDRYGPHNVPVDLHLASQSEHRNLLAFWERKTKMFRFSVRFDVLVACCEAPNGWGPEAKPLVGVQGAEAPEALYFSDFIIIIQLFFCCLWFFPRAALPRFRGLRSPGRSIYDVRVTRKWILGFTLKIDWSSNQKSYNIQ